MTCPKVVVTAADALGDVEAVVAKIITSRLLEEARHVSAEGLLDGGNPAVRAALVEMGDDIIQAIKRRRKRAVGP